MCEECRQTPCHPQCPNAPEAVPVTECTFCCEPIYEGDDYYDVNGDHICEECIRGARKTATAAEGED